MDPILRAAKTGNRGLPGIFSGRDYGPYISGLHDAMALFSVVLHVPAFRVIGTLKAIGAIAETYKATLLDLNSAI